MINHIDFEVTIFFFSLEIILEDNIVFFVLFKDIYKFIISFLIDFFCWKKDYDNSNNNSIITSIIFFLNQR